MESLERPLDTLALLISARSDFTNSEVSPCGAGAGGWLGVGIAVGIAVGIGNGNGKGTDGGAGGIGLGEVGIGEAVTCGAGVAGVSV
jgi:hypothetical protein